MCELKKDEKEIHIFSLKGIISIIRSILLRGINLFVILETWKRLSPDKIALICEEKEYTYSDLYLESIKLSEVLKNKYQLGSGNKVAIICSNHSEFVLSTFSTAAIGMNIYFLNIGMGEKQIQDILNRKNFNFVIHDTSISDCIKNTKYENTSLSIKEIKAILESSRNPHFDIGCSGRNKVVLLTSGTTGISVEAERNTKILPYIRAFYNIASKLSLKRRNSIYIAVPLSHGFGFIALLSAFGLGKKVFLQSKFDASKACELISKNQIDTIAIVPLMLSRMLAYDTSALQSLQCIISGGATLSAQLITKVQEKLGDILFNLYGTSETSVALIATPHDLKYSPHTIGQRLSGLKIRILDSEQNQVPENKIGHIQIKSGCSVSPNKWLETGDLGYRDKNGYYFLKGRIDDMIVSGGENVFPSELEDLLIQHPAIKEVVVKGIFDEEFGQRLKAFIVLKSGMSLSSQEIKSWLSTNTGRHKTPKEIEFISEIPLSSSEKPDKKKLI